MEREDVKISIKQADSQRATAMAAHLNQILRASVHDSALMRPVAMDQRELLLCAAAFRALLFDDTGQPMLLRFMEQHAIDVQIESVECKGNMLSYQSLLETRGPIHPTYF